MTFRKLQPHETDWERTWAALGGAIALTAAAWLAYLPVPQLPCQFKTVTGYPCPGCGSTRAVIALTQGRPLTALRLQPLMTPVYLLAAVALAYAIVAVLLGRRLRWRLPPTLAVWWPAAVPVLIVATWLYLICDGR